MPELDEYLISSDCAELLRIIAQDKELRGAPSAVFLLVLGSVAYEGFNICVQQNFAKMLGMDKSTVSRAFQLLCKKGILEKGENKYGTCHMYSVDISSVKKRKIEEARKNQKVKLLSIKGGEEA
jgi:DNA-binding MarR family transcriptional regulator